MNIRILFILGCVFHGMNVIAETAPSPKISPKPSPKATQEPLQVVGEALNKLTVSPTPGVVNKNILLREFLRAQSVEIKALEHQQGFDLKELKTAQDVRERDWKKSEADARHAFFDSHLKGEERRTYVRDFLQRRELLKKTFLDERTLRKKEHDARIAATRQEHASKFKEFKAVLERGEIPPTTLWPKAGQ